MNNCIDRHKRFNPHLLFITLFETTNLDKNDLPLLESRFAYR